MSAQDHHHPEDPDAPTAAAALSELDTLDQWVLNACPGGPWKAIEPLAALRSFVAKQAHNANTALHEHALEELHQLGYTVQDGMLTPPEHLGKLMVAAGHPLAAASSPDSVPQATVRVSQTASDDLIGMLTPYHPIHLAGRDLEVIRARGQQRWDELLQCAALSAKEATATKSAAFLQTVLDALEACNEVLVDLMRDEIHEHTGWGKETERMAHAIKRARQLAKPGTAIYKCTAALAALRAALGALPREVRAAIESAGDMDAVRQDAARYAWIAENAVVETAKWRHDGLDPASTKQPLDEAVDAALRQQGGTNAS